MTDLEKLLQHLKHIEPDPTYRQYSRAQILTTERNLNTRGGFWKSLVSVAEYSVAVSLVGLFLITILGGAPLGKILAPFQSSSLNTGSLRAEAEAIDIQMKILSVSYSESSSSVAVQEPTIAARTMLAPKPTLKSVETATTTSVTAETEATSTPSEPTITEVLGALSQ